MLRPFICLALLVFGSLTADLIDNITFSLPNSEDWELDQDVSNSAGHSIIYSRVDDHDDFDDSIQILVAQFFVTPFTEDNPADFEKWMQIAFPFFDMHCNLIEKTENSLTLELLGYDDQELEGYLLMRKIRSANGTVLLTYSCNGEFEIEEVKKQWLPILGEAKPV